MNNKILFIPLFFTLTACATSTELNIVRQDIDEMKTRLIQAEKNISDVKVQAKAIAEQSSSETLQELASLRKGTADIQANLDAMRVDVQVVNGKVDDLGLAAKKPFDDISLLKEDTAKSVLSMEEKIKRLNAEMDQVNAKLTVITKSLEKPLTADDIYKQAFDAYKAGGMAKARDLFNKCNEQFPDNKLAANARYWIGETYYSEKNYEQAALEFQRVIKEHPGKEKVPAAMLKQGLCFKEIGDTKSARFIIKELIDKFPNAEEIPAAKEFLQKLK